MAGVTKAEADALLAEPKECTANLSWKIQGSGFRLEEVVVLARQSNNVLRLRGYVGKKNYSFALLYKNQPIRRYTVHAQHTNPDGTRVRGPHKHTWDDIYQDNITYIPPDIPGNGDPNADLLAFLNECNITLIGSYHPLLRGGVR